MPCIDIDDQTRSAKSEEAFQGRILVRYKYLKILFFYGGRTLARSSRIPLIARLFRSCVKQVAGYIDMLPLAYHSGRGLRNQVQGVEI